MSDANRADRPWAAFGARLRALRRGAGLTQLQLGQLVGYHHTLISKLESGLREPPAGLADRLDPLLGSRGELAALAGALGPRRTTSFLPEAVGRALFAPLPGGEAPRGGAATGGGPRIEGGMLSCDGVPVHGTGAGGDGPGGGRGWPVSLPNQGVICPLHASDGCAVPEPLAVLSLLKSPAALRESSDADAVHGLTALLSCLTRAAAEDLTPGVLETAERVLHLVVGWARAVDATGRLPHAQLRLAAAYAQLAGQARMSRGQTALSTVWFEHGLRWACASDDVVSQASLLGDLCTLARLDRDAESALVYAQAMGALDPRRGWVGALAHLYQARGYGLRQDGPECRRHIELARRRLARLGRRDGAEAPWLTGADGLMRAESAVGGALRDLAAPGGDRATALGAVAATGASLAHLAPRLRPVRLLLTLRLADSHACAGDLEPALDAAAGVVEQAVSSEQSTVVQELRGLHARLTERWGDLPQVRDYRERVRDAAAVAGLP
ncbi:helix-turn-helix domain-containing protein [Streptomyces halstedii]|uniref:helix-turn-helix domain-containing protein n=1 Tax=Streptomyces halstedii TaxID=1944 RepID=UPI00386397CC|nr:helix-turn-helix domain-containing protein [Streptomyces halstedii]